MNTRIETAQASPYLADTFEDSSNQAAAQLPVVTANNVPTAGPHGCQLTGTGKIYGSEFQIADVQLAASNPHC